MEPDLPIKGGHGLYSDDGILRISTTVRCAKPVETLLLVKALEVLVEAVNEVVSAVDWWTSFSIKQRSWADQAVCAGERHNNKSEA